MHLFRGLVQFHTPRNLLLALTGEVGELCELFQWKGECKTTDGKEAAVCSLESTTLTTRALVASRLVGRGQGVPGRGAERRHAVSHPPRWYAAWRAARCQYEGSNQRCASGWHCRQVQRRLACRPERQDSEERRQVPRGAGTVLLSRMRCVASCVTAWMDGDQVKGSAKKHNQYKRMRVDKESV